MQKTIFTPPWLAAALAGLLWCTSGCTAKAPRPLAGTVTETMNSGGYTYMLVDDGQGQRWLATSLVTVKVGSHVDAPFGQAMKNFTSPTLKRTFPEIVFVDRIAIDGQPHQAPGMSPAEQAHGAASSGQSASLTGKVLETMDSGGYTFLRVQDKSRAIWAASEPSPVKVGDTVTLPAGMVMPNFHSASLNRTFDEILLVDHIEIAGQPGAAATEAGLPPGHPQIPGHPSSAGQTQAPAPAPLTAPIVQPAGAKSIATIFAQRKELAGQEITVRGQVTKFNAAIMGRNWLHLSDGTGAAGGNDLTVTTSETTTVGSVITVRGKLVIDQDFGYGYSYPLVLEQATIQKN